MTQNKKVGVIGTEATVRSRAYETAILGIDHHIEVLSKACPLFVPLAEEGWVHNEVALLAAQIYLRPFREQMIDTLVLGCTYYPLLKDLIGNIMGDEVCLVNSAKETAKAVKRVLDEEDLATSDRTDGSYKFYVTDNAERFMKVGGRFLGKKLTGVEEINW